VKLPGKSVYSTALAIFLAASLLLLGAVAISTRSVLLGEFGHLEMSDMNSTMQQLKLMIARETLRSLNSSVGDLSPWSELYKYAHGNNPQFPTEKLGPMVLENLELDFVAIYGPDGKLLHVACRDTDVDNLFKKSGLLVAPWGVWKDPDGENTHQSGFSLIEDHLVAVSIYPILKSDRSGPPAGRVVGGKFLNDGTWSFFNNLFSATVNFRTLNNRHITEVSGREIVDLLNSQQIVVQRSGPDQITGYILVEGMDGAPIGVVSLSQSRPLYTASVHASRMLLLTLALAGGVLVILMWVVLDVTILARIHWLIAKLESEKRSGRLPVQINFKGNDELATLAASIEDLALKLQNSQSQYRDVVEDQTEMICRFDAELRLIFANKIFLKTFQVDPARLDEYRLDELLPTRAWENFAMRFYELTHENPLITFIQDVPFAGGHNLWFRSALRRIFSAENHAQGGQWVLTDITKQLEAQRQMIESERRFRRLFETATDGILLLDAVTMEVSDINASLERMLQVSRAKVLGHRWNDLPIFAPCLPIIDSHLGRRLVSERSPEQNSCRLTGPDGTMLYVELRWVTYSVEQDEYLQINFRDISDRVRGDQELRHLSARLLRSQDEERRRIARELHDSTAQNVSALEMNLTVLDSLVSPDDTKASGLVADTRKIASECARELRNISYLLHPPLIDEVGLVFAIKWFVDGFSARTGIATTVEVDDGFPRLSSELEIPLFRILQEAMTNIYRHSGAGEASVRLWHSEDEVQMRIRDNGHGFHEPSSDDSDLLIPDRTLGVGLPGMRERLSILGGTLDIESTSEGVVLSISLPLHLLHDDHQNQNSYR